MLRSKALNCDGQFAGDLPASAANPGWRFAPGRSAGIGGKDDGALL
jgi:hypothetical protein